MIYATLTALDGVDLTVTEASFHGSDRSERIAQSTLLKCVAGAETASQAAR